MIHEPGYVDILAPDGLVVRHEVMAVVGLEVTWSRHGIDL